MRLWRMGVEDGTDDKHHGGHPRRTSQQRISTPEFVDSNDEEDTSRNHLHGAVNTGCKQRRVCLRYSDGLENLKTLAKALPSELREVTSLRSIVADAVSARKLLAEHDHEADEESNAGAWLETFFPRNAVRSSDLFID